MRFLILFLSACFLLINCFSNDNFGGGSVILGEPKITSLEGDGSEKDIFNEAIYVNGKNFDESSQIYLNNEFLTTYYLSSERLKGDLPSDLKEGLYKLTVETDYGKTYTNVQILKGEPGEDGMSILNTWECLESDDLYYDSSDDLKLINAYITEYTDGSYSIDFNYYFESSYFVDSGSSHASFAYDSDAVYNGILSTYNYWLYVEYDTVYQTIYIIDVPNWYYSDTIVCSQIYP